MVRLPAVLAVALAAALAGCGGGGRNGDPRPKPVSPSVLVNAVRTTQAAGYTMTVGGSVDVQGQGFPIRGRGQGGHIEVEVAGRRKVLDVSPARLLAYARSVKSAGQLGTETVDGVMTTHYDAEVRTPANLVRQAGDTIPVDVWVDASDRIRRVRARVTTPDFEAVPQVDLRAAPRAPRP